MYKVNYLLKIFNTFKTGIQKIYIGPSLLKNMIFDKITCKELFEAFFYVF